MSSKPYMQLYIGDYLGDTAHLSTLEHGAYMLLIMHYWQSGKPLPNSNGRLARIARMSNEEWTSVRDTLAEFFTDDGTNWVHKRIEKELNHFSTKSEKAKAAGIASAQQRFNGRSTDAEQTFNGRSTEKGTTHQLDPENGQVSHQGQLNKMEITGEKPGENDSNQRISNGRSTSVQRMLDGRSTDAQPYQIPETRYQIPESETTSSPLPPNEEVEPEVIHRSDFDDVVEALSRDICPVSNQVEADMIRDWIETMSRDWILEAIKQAALSKARSIKYVDKILQTWVSKYRLDQKPWELERQKQSRDRPKTLMEKTAELLREGEDDDEK